eukprot:1348781-Amorphochlora_amoeboformis.AAC.1
MPVTDEQSKAQNIGTPADSKTGPHEVPTVSVGAVSPANTPAVQRGNVDSPPVSPLQQSSASFRENSDQKDWTFAT